MYMGFVLNMDPFVIENVISIYFKDNTIISIHLWNKSLK